MEKKSAPPPGISTNSRSRTKKNDNSETTMLPKEPTRFKKTV